MSKKLNILFISSWYPTRLQPTNGDYVQNHAQAVGTKANVCTLHVCSDCNISQKETIINQEKGIIEYIRYIPEKKFFQNLIILLNYFSSLKQLRKKYNFTPDIIHANIAYPISIVARIFYIFYKFPYVLSEHSTQFIRKDFSCFQKFLLLFGLKRAQRIMPVSQDLMLAMQSTGVKGNYEVVPNIINIDIFKNITKTTSDIFRFIHVAGHTDKFKNTSGIIKACKLLTDNNELFKLHIVGKAKEYDYFLELVKNLNLERHVEFHGNVPHDKIVEKYSNADAFVLFSRYETFSIVVAEAMAAGLPIITTRSGGITMELSDKQAVFVEKENIEGLAAAMKKMIHKEITIDTNSLKTYAEQHYSADIVSAKFMNIYKSITLHNYAE